MSPVAPVPLFSLHVPMNPEKWRLLAMTQTMENYSDHPETHPHWKFKGGSEYLIAELNLAQAQREDGYLANAVECAKPYIEQSGPYYRTWIVGWMLLAPGELSEFERQQMAFEGEITSHPIAVAELQRRATVEKGTATVYLPDVRALSTAPINALPA